MIDDKCSREVDAIGLKCPLPVLRLRKALQAVETGGTVRLLTDDPVAVIDVPHFCKEAGHDLVASQADGSTRVFVVRRGTGS